MMQVLHKDGLPVAYDESRAADEHKPRGYYELEAGIINRQMDISLRIIKLRSFDGKLHKS